MIASMRAQVFGRSCEFSWTNSSRPYFFLPHTYFCSSSTCTWQLYDFSQSANDVSIVLWLLHSRVHVLSLLAIQWGRSDSSFLSLKFLKTSCSVLSLVPQGWLQTFLRIWSRSHFTVALHASYKGTACHAGSLNVHRSALIFCQSCTSLKAGFVVASS